MVVVASTSRPYIAVTGTQAEITAHCKAEGVTKAMVLGFAAEAASTYTLVYRKGA